MAVKRKKVTTKKTVKKTIKKAGKKAVVKRAAKKSNPKKTIKKIAKKKPVKKSVKKPAKKAVKKMVKKTVKRTEKVAVKRDIKKPAVIQKVVEKKVLPKKIEKKETPRMQQQRSIVQPSVSRPVMREKADRMLSDVAVVETAPRKKATTLLGALEFTPYQPEATEQYMSDLQRDHFRKILNAWKQQLMQDVDLTVGHLKEEAVFYADPVDRAAQEEGFNLELRTRDRERRLIKKIEQSLDLLNTSEYGFCEDCGAEIGIRRLEARPTAVKCIDCKTFQEIREKQLGG